MEWLTQPARLTPAAAPRRLCLSSPRAGDRHPAGDRESGCWCSFTPKTPEEPGTAGMDARGGEGMRRGAAVVGNRSYAPSQTPIPAGGRSWRGLGLAHPGEGFVPFQK